MILSDNDIKAEMSYAYLHAVAATAGISCQVTDRHGDGAGVDAVIRAKERFRQNSIYTDFTLEIQLKATSRNPSLDERGRYPFSLKLEHYNKLRDIGVHNQRILVVLFLPEDRSQWLSHSEDGLVARRCAYWVSLRNASASVNAASHTVYIPRGNVFSADSLRTIMAQVSLGEMFDHEL